MDITQLKSLAKLLRSYAASHGIQLGHSQALDAIAALVGFRGWPEVQAFSSRLADKALDISAANRLADRLRTKHGLVDDADALLDHLRGGLPVVHKDNLLWPSGPRPGVYLVDGDRSVDALLRDYESATGGMPVYVDDAEAAHGFSCIEIGRDGMFSPGMLKLPAGSLVVLYESVVAGQQNWSLGVYTMDRACELALEARLRLIVCVNCSESSCAEELALAMLDDIEGGHERATAIAGLLVDDGAHWSVAPFIAARPAFPSSTDQADSILSSASGALPQHVRSLIAGAFIERPHGLVCVSKSVHAWHESDPLFGEVVDLSAPLGPLAIVLDTEPRLHEPQPMRRNYPQLPVCASLQHAIKLGFKRVLLEAVDMLDEQDVADLSEVLVFVPGNGWDVTSTNIRSMTGMCGTVYEWGTSLRCVLATTNIGSEGKAVYICDLYLGDERPVPTTSAREPYETLAKRRTLRWEDEVDQAIAGQRLRLDRARRLFASYRGYKAWLSRRQRHRSQAAARRGPQPTYKVVAQNNG